jgi:hypothetical protein
VAGRFVSAALGYSIDLPAPWRRTECFSRTRGDLFVVVPEYDERGGDLGFLHDSVGVSAEPNPQRLTTREWKAAELGGESGETFGDVTFAGMPALRIVRSRSESYVIPKDDLMFVLSHGAAEGDRPAATTFEQRSAVVSSFRFLSEDERQAAPTAKVLPPNRPEEVADVLAEAFTKKDVRLLATVIGPCAWEYRHEAGSSTMDDARYLDSLRERFARGLEVTVRPRPFTRDWGDLPWIKIGSTWREPGRPGLEMDLVIAAQGERWYWRGTVAYERGRP